MIGGIIVSGVVVGLDLHIKNTEGTIMRMNGEIIRQEKFRAGMEKRRRFLECVPPGTRVALKSLGFCWRWIAYIKESEYMVRERS